MACFITIYSTAAKNNKIYAWQRILWRAICFHLSSCRGHCMLVLLDWAGQLPLSGCHPTQDDRQPGGSSPTLHFQGPRCGITALSPQLGMTAKPLGRDLPLLSRLLVRSTWLWKELPSSTYSVPRKTIYNPSWTVFKMLLCLLKQS